ncbi:GDSL-type esterase/lipase family protein [Eisenibacter elegans]|jgi:lysophospholipase L1-like esterase|uniref:GDSL-type esterase/lipase family protein n=1 Tax=Eisenibacter elegans TaxID=997 RepID=UPI0003FC3F39|nr:GDSL-type esterase/lipase family protein [Eisenibacter elegans]
MRYYGFKLIPPIRGFWLFAYVLAFLAILGWVLPQTLPLTDAELIHIPSWKDVWATPRDHYADITDIRERFESPRRRQVSALRTPEGNTSFEVEVSPGKAPTDSLAPGGAYVFDEKALSKQQRIQFPPNTPDTLLQPLMRALLALSYEERSVRLIHFGDSQLEGDRITSALRQKLQERFGGCGTGALFPMTQPSRLTLAQEHSTDWRAYTLLSARNSSKEVGLWGGVFRFDPPSATLRLNPSRLAFELAQEAEILRIFYRSPKPFELSLQEGAATQTLKVGAAPYHGTYEYPLAQFKWQPLELRLETKSGVSPDIYAFGLECRSGVNVDNVAWRGSSGTEFTRMDAERLKHQIKTMGVKCLIVQFGVNVVPYIRQDYRYFEELYYQQLRFLKQLSPDLVVLVVGVSDMSLKEGTRYISYPNITQVRDAQRNAAFRAGLPFWDLYEAMGGQNAMPSWVYADPPLATKDFTHFTNRGAGVVAEMLFSALLYEFDRFYYRQSQAR